MCFSIIAFLALYFWHTIYQAITWLLTKTSNVNDNDNNRYTQSYLILTLVVGLFKWNNTGINDTIIYNCRSYFVQLL